MEDVPKPRLVDGRGHPFASHIEEMLARLLPQFLRRYPMLRDDLVCDEVLNEAARKVAAREARKGPLEKLQGYVQVTVRSLVYTRERRGAARIARQTLGAGQSDAVFATLEASEGSAERIEQDVLVREVMAQLTEDERFVFARKAWGYSSVEIAEGLGTTAAAVDTLFTRAKDKARAGLGIPKVSRGTKRMGRPKSNPLASPARQSDPDAETDDGQ